MNNRSKRAAIFDLTRRKPWGCIKDRKREKLRLRTRNIKSVKAALREIELQITVLPYSDDDPVMICVTAGALRSIQAYLAAK